MLYYIIVISPQKPFVSQWPCPCLTLWLKGDKAPPNGTEPYQKLDGRWGPVKIPLSATWLQPGTGRGHGAGNR